MIIISGSMVFVPEDFPRAKTAASVLVIESRKEAGCRQYQFSLDLTAENTLCFYEEWETLEAFNDHRHSAHNTKFKKMIEDIKMISRDVKRYEIDRSNIIN